MGFKYGVVVCQHRFSINRSLDDYEEIWLNKCIYIGLELKYKTMACDELVYEVQIVYRDNENKTHCHCLDLRDWTISIEYLGDMKCLL